MVKDPRPQPPGSPQPDEALELLRALARSRGHTLEPSAPGQPEDPLDALRALAEKLDLQLRSTPPPDSTATAPPVFPPSQSAAPPFPSPLRPRFAPPEAHEEGWEQREARPRRDWQAQLATLRATMDYEWRALVAALPDAAATQDPDSLYFLILPLLPAKSATDDWRSVALQQVSDAFLLLSAKDALDGLRDGKLAVRPGRYTFSVLDSATGQTYSWNSATAVSRLSKKAPNSLKSLKLGFDFSEAQTGGQWSTEFKRDPGTCYWVSVLVPQ